MGDELLLKSKQLAIDIESKNAEYIQSLDVPSDMENRLQTLLQSKENLQTEIMSSHLQQMILKELELSPEQMLTERKMESNFAESEQILSESKATYEENLSKIDSTKQSVLEALDCLNVFLRELSQKIAKLENKYAMVESEWQKSVPMGTKALNPSMNKRAKDRILLLLENARDEKDMIEKRLSRLESLHKLAENTVICVQSDDESQMTVNRLQEKLSGLEMLSGVKCEIIDDATVVIQFIDPDTLRLSDEDKLVITLCFTPDESQRLELSAVNTNISIPEVETAAKMAYIDKDLPKLIRSLRKAWLSHVTLAAEISSLRERHAIDWKLDSRVFHLMIPKYICRFSIPPSYPCNGGCITLEQIMGGQSNLTSVTEENPPKDVSLTGWVTHLESLLT